MPEVDVAQLEIIRNLEKYIDTGCFADYRSFIKAVDRDIAIPYDHKRMARTAAQHLMFTEAGKPTPTTTKRFPTRGPFFFSHPMPARTAKTGFESKPVVAARKQKHRQAMFRPCKRKEPLCENSQELKQHTPSASTMQTTCL